MQLYDKDILQLKEMLENYPFRPVLQTECLWHMEEKETLILRSEAAYELGAGGMASVSGLAFTCSEQLVPGSGVYLCGNDLPQITEDAPCARVTLLRLTSEECLKGEQALYDFLRRLEYVRYHFYPQGYMMRTSAAKEREPVRVSKAAVQNGISFGKIGQCLQKAYQELMYVEAVETYFITLPDFPYQELKRRTHRFEQITSSLHHVFENLVMDCESCGLKELCDAVEGLRELHFGAAGIHGHKESI